MAEEAIDPPRHVPRSIMYVVVAVFAIYAFLPSVALSALPVQPATAQQVQRHEDVRLHEPGSEGRRPDVRPGVQVRERPGRRPRQEPRPPDDDRERPRVLRRDPRGDDPDHRDQRRDHRGVAADLLDGAAQTVTRGAAAHPPALLHAVRRDRPLQRRRGRAHARELDVPGQPVRVRGDALVHARPRLGGLDAAHHAVGRHALSRPAVVRRARVRRAALRRSWAAWRRSSSGSSRSPSTSRTTSRPSAWRGSRSGWSCTWSTAAPRASR